MRRYVGRPGFGVLAALFLVACDGGRENPSALARLEERVGVLERTLTAEEDPRHHTPDVAADMRSLERRLAGVEQHLAALAAVSPAAVAPLEGQIDQRRERRLKLRDLTQEYRMRLTAIREQQTDPAARQQAVREALEWYRTQRHAILAGNEPAAP